MNGLGLQTVKPGAAFRAQSLSEDPKKGNNGELSLQRLPFPLKTVFASELFWLCRLR